MAGHSQFKNIMHRKGAQDAKRAKIFTKVTREIISSCKVGAPDPTTNPRLRSAIQWARQENMPKDRVDAAIKRGSGDMDGENYEEVRYEGRGAGGVAYIVQGLTDNRNRTAPEIRSAFLKNGGGMAESGSVSFMFDHVGLIIYPADKASEDEMLEAAIEAGADNCISDENSHQITCSVEDFASVRDALDAALGEAESAKLSWQANTQSEVDEEQARQNMKLIEILEDNDDIQEVFTNMYLSDELMEKLST